METHADQEQGGEYSTKATLETPGQQVTVDFLDPDDPKASGWLTVRGHPITPPMKKESPSRPTK